MPLEFNEFAVYPCTYRELRIPSTCLMALYGISLYLQGTPAAAQGNKAAQRYIPVPTGNSIRFMYIENTRAVYPCTYRELAFSIDE